AARTRASSARQVAASSTMMASANAVSAATRKRLVPIRLPGRVLQCRRRRAPATSAARGTLAWSLFPRVHAMPESLPPVTEVEQACREAALATPAPELHGGLCGWLAGGGDTGGNWLAKVMVDDAL